MRWHRSCACRSACGFLRANATRPKIGGYTQQGYGERRLGATKGREASGMRQGEEGEGGEGRWRRRVLGWSVVKQHGRCGSGIGGGFLSAPDKKRRLECECVCARVR
eukprot:4654025-Pleurochrysis_carterae.AAC.1